ncbi:MAG: serine/threonine protein kinase [Alphaproteobacteria bacterium]|nr:serine/threonine protein kinase [Alphaproteobacteria bacterium]
MSTTESGRSSFDMRQRVGAGSFGEVYLATMSSAGGIRQEVAVKILAQDLDPRSQPVERLRDEGRILGSLNHPVILQVRDLVVLGGRIGLVTEYVPGADLSDVLEHQGALPPRVALQLAGHLGDALDTAWHAVGADGERLFLVHRDLKPANVRLTPHGTVKLLDFGIAKIQSADRETSTQYTVLMGSVPYMAPEVLHMDDEGAHVARDVYALGCVLFEALTGELWFKGLKRRNLRMLTARPERYDPWKEERLAFLEGKVDPGVVELIRRMVAHPSEERPSPREVADRAFELADDSEGPSLRGWARHFPWPTEHGDVGAWTGRHVQETTLSAASDGGGWLDDGPASSAGAPERRPGIASMGASEADGKDASVTNWLSSEDDTQGGLSPVLREQLVRGQREATQAHHGGPHPLVVVAVATVAAVIAALGVLVLGPAALQDLIPGLADVGAAPTLPAVSAGAPAQLPEAEAQGALATPPNAVEPVAEAPAAAPPPAPPPTPAPAVRDADAPAHATASAPRRVEPERTPVRRTAVQVARAPVADAAPASTPTFAVDLGLPGRVDVDAGDGVTVELHRGDAVLSPGSVAPGSLEVHADFGDGLRKRLVVIVQPASSLKIRCHADLGVCEIVH